MQLLLPMDHFAPSGAVDTLACVQVQSFQVLGQAGPKIAAGHRLHRKLVGANLQRPGQKTGDGLACFCKVMNGSWQPG